MLRLREVLSLSVLISSPMWFPELIIPVPKSEERSVSIVQCIERSSPGVRCDDEDVVSEEQGRGRTVECANATTGSGQVVSDHCEPVPSNGKPE